MQIRYLEAMQAMAKTSNSKVIFLPSMNQTAQQDLGFGPAAIGEGSSSGKKPDGTSEGVEDDGALQQAINMRNIENI